MNGIYAVVSCNHVELKKLRHRGWTDFCTNWRRKKNSLKSKNRRKTVQWWLSSFCTNWRCKKNSLQSKKRRKTVQWWLSSFLYQLKAQEKQSLNLKNKKNCAVVAEQFYVPTEGTIIACFLPFDGIMVVQTVILQSKAKKWYKFLMH